MEFFYNPKRINTVKKVQNGNISRVDLWCDQHFRTWTRYVIVQEQISKNISESTNYFDDIFLYQHCIGEDWSDPVRQNEALWNSFLYKS